QPEALEALHRLADLAEGRLSDPARVETALREAVRREGPGGGRAFERLRGHLASEGKQAALAELLGDEAARTQDVATRVGLYRQMAEIYRRDVDDLVAAASCLEQAVSLTPDDRGLVLELADLYLDAGRAEEAVATLQRVVDAFAGRRVKEAALFHHRLGRAYEALGDVPSALDAYEAAFRVDLSSVPVLRDLGRLCHAQGDFDKAQKTFRALLLQKLDGDEGIRKADVYFYLGDISAKQGDATKAIHMLERAVNEDGGHPEAEQLLSSLR
ncbi:MAG TPA: tetratricopeptide repeat protein, partial [Polyangiaceae bacterium LLY-WYZ-14_1]|nr:tetratricopeptide repeat protein [Polyangiaceae bacterium LLY-WYZ-14_1]